MTSEDRAEHHQKKVFDDTIVSGESLVSFLKSRQVFCVKLWKRKWIKNGVSHSGSTALGLWSFLTLFWAFWDTNIYYGEGKRWTIYFFSSVRAHTCATWCIASCPKSIILRLPLYKFQWSYWHLVIYYKFQLNYAWAEHINSEAEAHEQTWV